MHYDNAVSFLAMFPDDNREWASALISLLAHGAFRILNAIFDRYPNRLFNGGVDGSDTPANADGTWLDIYPVCREYAFMITGNFFYTHSPKKWKQCPEEMHAQYQLLMDRYETQERSGKRHKPDE
jgi:hypothetical protein